MINDVAIKNKILTGIFWKFAERICAQFISLLVSIFLARILLPEEYGSVSLILIFITIANVFVTSGLSTALIQKKNANEVDFSTIFYCTLLLSIIIYVFLFFFSKNIANFYNMPELKWYIRIFSIKILISSYNSIQHAYVSRHMLFKKFFFSTIIGTIISGIVGIVMALKGFGAWAIIAQYLTNSIIDTLILNFTIPWHPKYVFEKKSAKSLFGFGWKVLLTDLIGTLFDNLRSLIIGKVYTTSDLAFYNKGQQFPQFIGNNIDTSLTSVLFPAMSNSSDNLDKIKSMTKRALKISSYIILPLMIGLCGISENLVIVLLTEKWLDCVIFLRILSISQAFSTLSKINLQALKALGRSDVTLKLEFIKKPIYLIILLFAIKHSVLIIAISMLIYSVIGTFINMIPSVKLINYSIKEQISDIIPYAVLSLVVFFIIYFVGLLNINKIVVLLLQMLIGCTLYLLLSICLKIDSYVYLKDIILDIVNRRKYVRKNN